MSFPEFRQLNISTAVASQARLFLTDPTEIPDTNLDGLRKVFRHSGPWPPGLIEAAQPIPIFLPEYRMIELQKLAESLHTAVCDIIERWWTDLDARFWERMPIDPRAEAVLRWVTEKKNKGGPYRDTSGFWRPDVLISDNLNSGQNGISIEDTVFGPFKVCEINCRYPLSGYLIASTLESFYSEELKKVSSFQTTVAEVDTTIRRKFAPYHVVWFLHGEGIYHVDLMNMKAYFEKHGFNEIRFVRPEHLTTIADAHSPSGYKLVATRSASDLPHAEEIEMEMEIDIVVIEARQAQLVALPTDVLQQLALRAMNDLRSVFLTHDKRLLGLILEELDDLTTKRGVLSAEQSDCLQKGLAETYGPNSAGLAKQLEALRIGTSTKNDWVLKPIASGKGKGIIFGAGVDTEDHFYELVKSNEQTGANVLQRVVLQPRFRMVAPGERLCNTGSKIGDTSDHEPPRYLVGTFMMADGQFLGTLWRASREPICAFSQGAWLLSAVTERKEFGDL